MLKSVFINTAKVNVTKHNIGTLKNKEKQFSSTYSNWVVVYCVN